jgi:hypothetical protein
MARRKRRIEMTDLIKTASSREQHSHIAYSEIIAMVVARSDGTLSRADFIFEPERNVYIGPTRRS